MAFSWQGLMYVEDGIISRGGVARHHESLPWTAIKCDIELGQVPLGDYPTVEEAKQAVERAYNPSMLPSG